VIRALSAALLVCGYAALATLFALDVFARPDQWAVDHLMPGGDFTGGEPRLLDAVVPLLHSDWDSGWGIAADIVTLPAGLLVSLAIAALLSRRLALVVLAAVAVEALCKETLRGPALYDGGLHIVAFDSSFPSGHTLRAVILAGAAALLLPRLRVVAIAWAVAAVVLLVAAGWHTPTDVAGGIVLGLLVMWPVTLPGSWVASSKRCKDAGSADSSALGATEDAAARR
jgi:membrane-associated phospholipid phosphatase